MCPQGSPMSDLLKWSHATVTVCHSKTSNLPSHTRQVGDFLSLPLPPCCLIFVLNYIT